MIRYLSLLFLLLLFSCSKEKHSYIPDLSPPDYRLAYSGMYETMKIYSKSSLTYDSTGMPIHLRINEKDSTITFVELSSQDSMLDIKIYNKDQSKLLREMHRKFIPDSLFSKPEGSGSSYSSGSFGIINGKFNYHEFSMCGMRCSQSISFTGHLVP